MTRGELAEKYFVDGYNCCQSAVLAFSDLTDLDKSTLLKLSSSFGGGFGRLREVCGAFSGICIIAGLLKGYDRENGVSKMEHYALVQRLGAAFKEANGSLICRELTSKTTNLSSPDPAVRTEEYMQKRPCKEICKNAADILVKELNLKDEANI